MISSILFNLKVCSLSAKEKRSIFVKSPFNDLGPLIHRLICDKFSINVIYTHFLLLETEPNFCVCGLNIDFEMVSCDVYSSELIPSRFRKWSLLSHYVPAVRQGFKSSMLTIYARLVCCTGGPSFYLGRLEDLKRYFADN